MPSLWFRLVLFNSKKKKEDLEMLQYNFTKGKKETLQNWSAFRLCCKTKTIYRANGNSKPTKPPKVRENTCAQVMIVWS